MIYTAKFKEETTKALRLAKSNGQDIKSAVEGMGVPYKTAVKWVAGINKTDASTGVIIREEIMDWLENCPASPRKVIARAVNGRPRVLEAEAIRVAMRLRDDCILDLNSERRGETVVHYVERLA